MIKLQLKIDGKKKTFRQEEISTRTMRYFLAFHEKMEKVEKGEKEMTELEQFDSMIDVVCKIFDDEEVNFDNILDGIPAQQFEDTIWGVINEVNNLGEDEKKSKTPKPKSVSKSPEKH